MEGGREEGREGRREGGREGGMEGGRERGTEERREGGKQGNSEAIIATCQLQHTMSCKYFFTCMSITALTLKMTLVQSTCILEVGHIYSMTYSL